MMSFLRQSAFISAATLSLLILIGCQPNVTRPSGPTSVIPAPIAHFVDVADKSGLHYQWQVAGTRPLNILQSIGNGCAFLDYNNDGNLDILLLGPQLGLFSGDGHGHFTDVTHAMGLDKLSGHFLGCAIGDYDNDGWDDIYISGYRTGLLLHNQQGKRFVDVTAAAGLTLQPWGTSCAWADVDGDGRLDLCVVNYLQFGFAPGIPQLCESHGIKTSCGPRSYAPLKGVFFRNLGRGHFVNDASALRLDKTNGRGLGLAFAPLDETGRPTLAIANDELPGDLMTPVGKDNPVHYTNRGSPSGMAFDRDGNIHGGMGTDWGDYDNDGRLDLFVATFQSEAKSLYHNDGGGGFNDASYLTGLALPTMPNVAFGCKLFDFDNDGWLDLIIANGHIQDNIHVIDSSATYRQATQLFHNKGGAHPTFDNVSAAAGPDLTRPIVGRGLAVGDYDNDGRVDALVVDSEGKPLLLHNESSPTGHWLSIQLQGTKSNRDGIGALLTATVGGRKLVRFCHADGSYLSSSDRRVHFGLGKADSIDSLTIRWPSGLTSAFKNVRADHFYTAQEGDVTLH